MRRHYTNYFRGLPQIKTYRSKLVESMDYLELIELIEKIKNEYA